ncbi:MAG: RNase P modulator RnpM [Anaerovoracaceae bacterium]
MKQKKIPMRKCVGCGRSRPQKELVRLAKDGERIIVDRDGKAPGRGVYLCPDPACCEKAKKRRSLQRSFGTGISDDDIGRIIEEVTGNGGT